MSEEALICAAFCDWWSWVPPTFSVLADIGSFLVGVGVLAAFKQVTVWRRQGLAQRQADVAVNLLAAANEAAFALNSVRSAMEHITPEAGGSSEAGLREKGERLDGYSSVFDELRKQQVLAKALLLSPYVDQAVKVIFDVRTDVYAALVTLFSVRASHVREPERVAFYEGLRSSLYRTGGERDKLSAMQDDALKDLERMLIPFVQLRGKA